MMACEYCEGEEPYPLIHKRDDWSEVYVVNGHIAMEKYTPQWRGCEVKEQMLKPINYCPMCGRDLRGDD